MAAKLSILFSLVLWLGLNPDRAFAHPLVQNAMWVMVEPGRVHVAVDVTVREVCVAQGLPSGAGSDASAVSAAMANHGRYVFEHIRLTAGGQPLGGRVVGTTPPKAFGDDESTRFQVELEYPYAGTGELGISQRTLSEFAYAPGQAWEINYIMRIKRAGSEVVESGLLRTGSEFNISGALREPASGSLGSSFRRLREYVADGIMHILTGYDHLLFVSALVLATLSLWEMAKVIAAFTLAHTITLTLAALDLVRLPTWFVEPVIAASIVFVALENIFWPERTQSRIRLFVAFGFGLIHGMGFAGGLLDAMKGLPGLGLGLAIAAFSLGVEIGHMTVVLPLFGTLRFGQSRSAGGFRPAVLRYGSMVISACGVYYLIHAL